MPPTRRDFAIEEVTTRATDAGGFPSRTVLCANDRLAFGVMSPVTQRGLRVGRKPDCDLRLAGHENHPLSRFSCPSLTTVAQDYEGMAKTGLSLLLPRLGGDADAGEGSRTSLFETKLMIRDSA